MKYADPYFNDKYIFYEIFRPVRPKLVPKLKMLRIYWNLAHFIFRISWSRFWCQRLFLLNIYRHMLGPNWSQIKKYSGFIEIWQIQDLKYGNLHFDVKNVFYQIFTNCQAQLVPKWKMLRIYWNLAELVFQIWQSQFWFQKWFLLNIYYLLRPKLVQN